MVKEWFTKEEDLPSEDTDEVFMVKVIDLKTKEEFFSIAMFIYWPVRKPIDYDEWRMVCGANCFARFSADNIYKVVAWAKLKIV